jgi:hypothetical protein
LSNNYTRAAAKIPEDNHHQRGDQPTTTELYRETDPAPAEAKIYLMSEAQEDSDLIQQTTMMCWAKL